MNNRVFQLTLRKKTSKLVAVLDLTTPELPFRNTATTAIDLTLDSVESESSDDKKDNPHYCRHGKHAAVGCIICDYDEENGDERCVHGAIIWCVDCGYFNRRYDSESESESESE